MVAKSVTYEVQEAVQITILEQPKASLVLYHSLRSQESSRIRSTRSKRAESEQIVKYARGSIGAFIVKIANGYLPTTNGYLDPPTANFPSAND